MNSVLETIVLLGNLAGRSEKSTAVGDMSTPSKTTYTVTVMKHGFFDPEQSMQYNLESAMMIASPVSLVCAAVLCYYSYQSYPTSLFDDEGGSMFGGGIAPDAGYGGGGYGSGGFGGGGFSGGGGNANPNGGGSSRRILASAPPLFSGQGQRLGSA